MDNLAPEDQPDTIRVGPVHDIPIIDDDDPRFESERLAWSHARSVAQALNTTAELLHGLGSEDWMVRYESVDRLIARGREDQRTLPALLKAAVSDSAWQVRDKIVVRLHELESVATVAVLHNSLADPSEEVRWSAGFSLFQLGRDPGPGWSPNG